MKDLRIKLHELKVLTLVFKQLIMELEDEVKE